MGAIDVTKRDAAHFSYYSLEMSHNLPTHISNSILCLSALNFSKFPFKILSGLPLLKLARLSAHRPSQRALCFFGDSAVPVQQKPTRGTQELSKQINVADNESHPSFVLFNDSP